ncbi:MAG: VOC family protein [Microthrixaceae bacterium]
MSIEVTPHLNFRGEAHSALEFYREAFGGELTLVTYADAGTPADAPGAGEVMWGQVTGPEGMRIMAYDVPAAMAYEQGDNSYFVSVRGTEPEEITRHWKALSEGSTVVVELAPAPWAPLYGMLTDPYGVTWVLDVVPGTQD